MVGDKKSDGRRERSRQTRRRIVEAATHLFLLRGYVASTIEDVAGEAGVAVQTVYYVFGTKPQLLAAVLDASIAGDVEPVPIVERAWVDSVRAEQDAATAVRQLVDATVPIVARAAPIYEVVRRASSDPDVSVLLEDTRRKRRRDQRTLIALLAQAGHLSPEVTIDIAADAFYGLVNEEVFQLLTGDCEWDVDRYRSWATGLMVHQLLDAEPAAE
jgi:AcrR family transcriptional regulator